MLQAQTSPAQAPLSIQKAAQLAASLARREARHPDDTDDLVQVALFAFHKAATKSPLVNDPYAHARTVLQRAMWGYYSSNASQFDATQFVPLPDDRFAAQGAPSQLRYYQIQRGQDVALFAGLDGAAQDRGAQTHLFELEDYFDAVEHTCGPTARTMVVNLVSPDEECSRRIVEAAWQKQEVQRQLKSASQSARRHQPRGVQNEIRLSQRVIRLALGIAPCEWNRNMRLIRDFTLVYFPRIRGMLAAH